MILVRNLRLEPGEDLSRLSAKAAKKLRVSTSDIAECRVVKRSLDARKKNDIHYTCSAAVALRAGEDKLLARFAGKDVCAYTEPVYDIPHVEAASRPIVVGFGPAGMFAALVLARAGASPIVLERGQDALSRKAAVDAFRSGGELDPESNVQFGEGGAGTFSDGKLNTGTHDKRMFWVLREFAAHGAPESVTYDAKPHIGTDVLIDVVQNLRREIISLGGEVRFGSRLDGIVAENGRLTHALVHTAKGNYTLPCTRLILAIGHSARDSFEMLRDLGLDMERKPFSMGVRIEHRQADVDAAQYRALAGHPALPPSTYKLSCHLPNGRSAFSFCVCPGGQVVAAASETGRTVTNGMSEYARDGENINGALLVNVTAGDFPSPHPLAGIALQRQVEEAAFALGGGDYRAPCQRVEDFLRGAPSAGAGRVTPSYRPGVVYTDMARCLPPFIAETLRLALPVLGKKLKGYDDPDALLTGVETRSSSPVRLVRDDRYEANIRGIYPCGEGAGYAGGILSAAADGMRCAEKLLEVCK
ncbi:MAG TPA: hypothetical protein DHW47_00810 [Oscillibacter sp.]|nr:hypothetical protein [Oscillibacter sp.]